MEPLSIIATTLLAKCTLNCITESVFTGWVGNRADYFLSNKLPDFAKRITNQFKDTDKPINHDLQKAILSSHWLATKVFCEELKKNAPSDIFNAVLTIASKQIIQINDSKYVPVKISPDMYEADFLILKDNEKDASEILKNKVIEYHLQDLRGLLKEREVVSLSYKTLENAITNNLENLNWFGLVCAFLSELLTGDNNNAKDAFQNQELAKIGLEVAEIKQVLAGFEHGVKVLLSDIGEERFEEFKVLINSDLHEIKGSLNGLHDKVEKQTELLSNLVYEIDSLKERINEVKTIISKGNDLNFQRFPDYRRMSDEKSELDKLFDEKRKQKDSLSISFKDITDKNAKATLEIVINNYDKELLFLDEKRETVKRDLKIFVDNSVRTWISLNNEEFINSPDLFKAKELFESGDLAGANAVLDYKTLQNEYLISKKADEIVRQKPLIAQKHLIKANLIVLEKSGKDWFNEAKDYYEKAVELNSNYENSFAFACFLHNNNKILEAISMYEKSLTYIQDSYEKIFPLNNLAILQSSNNEVQKAEKKHEEAISICRSLSFLDKHDLAPLLATTLNNFGIFKYTQKEYDKALLLFYEALELRKMFSNLSDRVETLNNLGLLFKTREIYDQAELNYNNALQISRELKDTNYYLYSMKGSMVQLNLATLYRTQRLFEKAEVSFLEALKLKRELANSNPNHNLPDIAGILNNYGNLLTEEEKFKEAKNIYDEALGIVDNLIETYPQTYLPYKAHTMHNLGNLYVAQEEYGNAEKSYTKAFEIYKELVNKNPQIYLSKLRGTLQMLVNIFTNQNNTIEVIEKKYEEVFVLYRVLCTENSNYLPEFGTLIYDFGNLLAGKNENFKAARIFSHVINIRENLAQQNPKDYQITLSKTLIHVSLFYLFNKPDKRESLNLSLGGYINALPLIYNNPEAKDLCQRAKEVWQDWGEDLMKYLEENQGNENNV